MTTPTELKAARGIVEANIVSGDVDDDTAVVNVAGLIAEILSAQSAQPQAGEPVADEREWCKLYHSRWPTEDLLKAREPGGLITDDGEAWKYHYTHSDAQGGPYDLVYRPVTPPHPALAVKVVASRELAIWDAIQRRYWSWKNAGAEDEDAMLRDLARFAATDAGGQAAWTDSKGRTLSDLMAKWRQRDDELDSGAWLGVSEIAGRVQRDKAEVRKELSELADAGTIERSDVSNGTFWRGALSQPHPADERVVEAETGVCPECAGTGYTDKGGARVVIQRTPCPRGCTAPASGRGVQPMSAPERIWAKNTPAQIFASDIEINNWPSYLHADIAASQLADALAERDEARNDLRIGMANFDSLEAERDRLAAENARLREDADRWNALLRCARIRMQGSAGFDPKTGERREYSNATGEYQPSSYGWVHFGAEFWSVYPGHEDEDLEGRWGSVALKALADDVLLKERAALAAGKE